jgi:hypothetical protein
MNASPAMLEYLEPTSPRHAPTLMVPVIGDLRGKTIAYVDNGWSSFGKIGVRVAQVLRDKYGIADFRIYPFSASSAMPAELPDRIAREADAAIVGMAN